MTADRRPIFEDRPLLTTPIVTVGRFVCSPEHARFEDSGRIRQDCFVFPRLAVAIEHEHDEAFVANSTVVTFYNAGQAYRRTAVSPAGDRCHWFAIDREIAREVVFASGARPEDSAAPFSWPRRPSDARLYLEQRRLTDGIQSGAIRDAATVEEAVIDLLGRAITGAVPRHPSRVSAAARAAIHDAEGLLSQDPARAVSLTALSRAIGLSVFHMCRAFHQVTGRTIAAYRRQLRLRAALDDLRSGRRPLVDVALDAGFCSHSHFSDAFRREFGLTPSAVRRAPGEPAPLDA